MKGRDTMRKNWLLIGVGLLVAVLAIGAIACGDDDDDGDNGDNGASLPFVVKRPVRRSAR